MEQMDGIGEEEDGVKVGRDKEKSIEENEKTDKEVGE